MDKKYICASVLGHVDAGKTTLSESFLYNSGKIRKLGRVDHKDAFLDTNELERERGITIFSKQAVFEIEDMQISLLDTPGHVDFSAETERTLQVLDYAILLISGTDGVQAHTNTLWTLLKRYGIPAFIFVNKMDIANRDREDIMAELKENLGGECIDFTDTESSEFMEDIAVCDEELLDAYMDGEEISREDIQQLISERKVFPCYFGSALKLEGVKEFMDGLYKFIVMPEYKEVFAAKVYKIARDDQGKRLTYMKITGGSLRVKEVIRDTDEKIEQIRIYSGTKYTSVNEAQAGMVCAVTGPVKTLPGMCLGAEDKSEVPLLEPVMTYKVMAEQGTDMHRLLGDMRQLEEEDPQLHIVWNETTQEINAQLMGEVQIEVLKRLVFERFQTEIDFGKGNIVYKETIRSVVEGVGHFEPLRHYAEVHILMEPGEPDSGIVVSCDCKEEELNRNWQRLICTHLEEREHPGVLTGSSITDIKITVTGGRAHQKHTEGGDFRQATYRAVRQGLMQAESVLLEPYYEFMLTVPSECVGRAMTDIQRMNGSFEGPELQGEFSVLKGEVPVSSMTGYMTEVNSYTAGRGKLSCSLCGYRECHNAEEIIESIAYNPDDDVNNPTGSVFCAHGAGFYVPWYQVPDYMHVEGRLISKAEDESKSEIYTQAVKRQSSIEADDEELEAIFERTFGSIGKKLPGQTGANLGYEARKKWKKKEHTYTKEELETYQRYHKKDTRDSKEYLLVDGYNIIFSWEELNMLSKVSLDSARTKLMDILCNYQGYMQCTLILVFDAYKVKGNPGNVIKYHNINVVYTKEAETADMYIEKVTHEIGRKHNVTVATSDGLEQIIVASQGARRISAREFKGEIERVSKLIEEIIT